MRMSLTAIFNTYMYSIHPHFYKSISCNKQWLGQSNRSQRRIQRICSKTDAQDVCPGTCRPDDGRCIFPHEGYM